MTSRDKKLEDIGAALWKRTQRDWALTVNCDLCEPTCPTATISCQDEAGYKYWRADRDTIDEAIDAVVELAYAGLFQGSDLTGVPWSEPTLKPVPAEPTK